MSGVAYAACKAGCLPLPIEGLVPPRGSEDFMRPLELEEHPGEVRVELSMESGDVSGVHERTLIEDEPPVGWLSTIWEGVCHAAT